MRFVVEVRYTDDGVEGEVVAERQSLPQRFSSWLELLRLLEQPGPPHSTQNLADATCESSRRREPN
jgi:hypothetical protein